MGTTPAIRLGCAVVLIAAILVAARARAPRRPTAPRELRRLVGAALVLYGAGIVALTSEHDVLATFAFAGGVATSTLAAWLSRGRGGPEDDGDGGPPLHHRPPPDPGGEPLVDWDRFEREFRRYAAQRIERRSADR